MSMHCPDASELVSMVLLLLGSGIGQLLSVLLGGLDQGEVLLLQEQGHSFLVGSLLLLQLRTM